MKIDEILRISTQNFPIRGVEKLLKLTQDGYGYIDDLIVNYVESGDDRVIVLTDKEKIAAFAGFISRLNGRVWQSKNLQTYDDYRGRNLGGKIYKYVREVFKKSIQSDIEQSQSSEILWTKTLPKLGMNPKIFDTRTEYIIDKSNITAYSTTLSKMYTSDDNDSEKYRYTWILEKFDHYNENSILRENTILMPYTRIWYNFKE